MPVATVAGAKHIVCYVNPVFCSLVGKSKSELIGSPFAEMVPVSYTHLDVYKRQVHPAAEKCAEATSGAL